ncbi:c-type cytochrome [Skermanella pratensis]|uniref:c-type cytochrome n=1 Tax=Skermanella pratensis TaxID=2233999 RepID=UPI001300EFD7|nr:cytochrome c [Skermanella pratensis]
MPVPTVLGRKTALVAALVLFATGGLAAWMLSPEDGRIDPGDPAQVALGETVYAANCASCHGADLEGQPDWRERKPDGRLPAPPHDVSGHTWHHPAETLFGIVKDGMAAYAPPGYESDMPAFGGTLSDQEIRAVLAFIASRWPENVRNRWKSAGIS